MIRSSFVHPVGKEETTVRRHYGVELPMVKVKESVKITHVLSICKKKIRNFVLGYSLVANTGTCRQIGYGLCTFCPERGI